MTCVWLVLAHREGIALLAVDPGSTPYDLRFRLGPIPVQVHPFFWLLAGFLGVRLVQAEMQAGRDGTSVFIIWMVVVFVSILVHELGHALTALQAGWPPKIILYAFGGLAVFSPTYRDPRTMIWITFAGPLAGFLLAGLTLLAIFLAGWQPQFSFPLFQEAGVVGVPIFWLGELFYITLGNPPQERFHNLELLVFCLLFVNIFWGLLNLLPIYPLDGGQISAELLQVKNGGEGLVQALQLSMVFAVIVAVVAIALMKSVFMMLMFGLLAYNNWQMMQQLRGYGGGGGFGGGGFRRW